MNQNNQDKELIQLFHSLPKYELNSLEQEKVLHHITNEISGGPITQKKIKPILSRLYVSIAIFFIFIIGTTLYLSEQGVQKQVSTDDVWKLTGKFHLLDKDGSIVYHDAVRGIEGKIGYLDNGLGDFVALDSRKGAKMFWYVWGNPEELIGKTLQATATHRETGEHFLLNETTLTSGIYGSDAHALTSFNPFPKEGLWKINVEIDHTPFAELVVNVKSPYIQTEMGTFLISEDDLYAGNEIEVYYEINEQLGDELIITGTKLGTDSYSKEFIFTKQNQYINSEDNTPATLYKGNILFEEKGTWSLLGLGGGTTVKVK